MNRVCRKRRPLAANLGSRSFDRDALLRRRAAASWSCASHLRPVAEDTVIAAGHGELAYHYDTNTIPTNRTCYRARSTASRARSLRSSPSATLDSGDHARGLATMAGKLGFPALPAPVTRPQHSVPDRYGMTRHDVVNKIKPLGLVCRYLAVMLVSATRYGSFGLAL